MKPESFNSIWGVPLLTIPTSMAWGPNEISKFGAIDRQLQTFLVEQIDNWKPDLIIVVERKGTAIVRALKEDPSSQLKWDWINVISSESLDQMPDDYFRGKRILVFDDMMKTASHIRKVLANLTSRGLINKQTDLRIAVFAVHEECPSELTYDGRLVPYVWFFKHLSSVNYQSIQIEIVKMLQSSGSLMLDTEHLEVRLRLHTGFNRLFRALSRTATAHPFRSSDERMNITVFYEPDEAHILSEYLFPKGTSYSSIVRKCRIVDRGNDEYAIIPICFPSVATPIDDLWPSDELYRLMLGEGIKTSPSAVFYGVGLMAALEVLRWTLKDLAVLENGSYTILLPTSPGHLNTKNGYTLEHLTVMFPTLDVARLTDRIAAIDREASSQGASLRHKKFDNKLQDRVNDLELHHDALQLLQLIRYELDRRILEAELLGDHDFIQQYPCGLTLAEIFELGERMKWDNAVVSTLCDILIDQAALSTDVMRISDRSGSAQMVRTFAPAGEVVSEMVRQYSTQWGLPYGF